MHSREFVSFVFLAVAIYSPLKVFARAHPTNSLYDQNVDPSSPFSVAFETVLPNSLFDQTFEPSSPFSVALETLQKQISYTFESIGLLRCAMTHASFSEENNKALSILGANLIETSVSLRLLGKDVDISSKDLNRRILEISNVESSCAVDGMRLGLHKVVRVSPKTNSSTPAVVCGAFRAIFGAIAVDTGRSDDAGSVFWNVHGGHIGRALAR